MAEWTDDDIEQAWRNGWGSALNSLRAADHIVSKRDVGMPHETANKIIRELVNNWIASIDSLTENFVEAGREVGFASTEHLR